MTCLYLRGKYSINFCMQKSRAKSYLHKSSEKEVVRVAQTESECLYDGYWT